MPKASLLINVEYGKSRTFYATSQSTQESLETMTERNVKLYVPQSIIPVLTNCYVPILLRAVREKIKAMDF